MKKIPMWVMTHLGEKVQLSKPYSDGFRIHQAGSLGTMISIQAGDRGKHYATVTLDNDCAGAEENFDFSHLRPA